MYSTLKIATKVITDFTYSIWNTTKVFMSRIVPYTFKFKKYFKIYFKIFLSFYFNIPAHPSMVVCFLIFVYKYYGSFIPLIYPFIF